MKKMLILLVFALMVVLLVGCGSPEHTTFTKVEKRKAPDVNGVYKNQNQTLELKDGKYKDTSGRLVTEGNYRVEAGVGAYYTGGKSYRASGIVTCYYRDTSVAYYVTDDGLVSWKGVLKKQ